MKTRGAVVCAGCCLLLLVAAASRLTITQRNRAFSTSHLVIQTGDSITFVNEDDVTHSLYSETVGTEFDALQRPGQSSTVRFAQPGVIEVRCAIHNGMRLEVQVRP